MSYVYRADVLRALLQHGIRPTEGTPPELAREFVRDLYRYELRNLRAQMLRQAFPKHEFAGRVIRLRDRYRVLSLLPREFLEASDDARS